MPSNVRTFEKSCDNLADGRAFYQCQTCEPSNQLYLCSDCLYKSGHTNHKLLKILRHSSDYSGIVFCNCGDITGQLWCSDHKIVKLKNRKELPLHYNNDFRLEFIQNFNIIDQDVRKLSRLNQIKSVYKNSEDGRLISTYFKQTNAHKYTMHINKVYSIMRKDQEQKFVDNGFDKERRFLLWHGTKRQFLHNILENGFRRPASGTGLMFGNGIYFADRVSKSANYTDNTGNEVLLLCEVALGSMYRTDISQTYTKPPNNYQSVKGIGKYMPNKNDQERFGDVIVPLGKTVPNPKVTSSQLEYNEYITFDPKRALIKFIVHFSR